MKDACLLILNPGSTSTKVALFDGEALLHEENLEHSAEELAKFKVMVDQFDFRMGAVKDYLARHNVAVKNLTGVASRGGVVGQTLQPGAYLIDDTFLEAVAKVKTGHPTEISPRIASEIAKEAGVNAYCYDLVCGAGKPNPLYQVSGIPQIKRPFETHVLNSRAVCFEQAKRDGVHITEQNYIVAHMGGGITTNLVEKGVIIDLVADDEGTFSPERAGGLPCRSLVKLCYSGKYTKDEMLKLMKGKGGITAYLGTTDLRDVVEKIDGGDQEAKLIFDALVLQIAKNIASLSAVVCGKVDRVILTGGMAYSQRFTDAIAARVAHIAPICVIPGAYEMDALGQGVYRVLTGVEAVNPFRP